MITKIRISRLKPVLMLLFVLTTMPFAIAQHQGHGGMGAGGFPPTPPVQKTENYNYLCPMHPDIVSDRPGLCPTCGMGMERKKTATSKTEKRIYYYCMDHPDYESDKKGICGSCGSKLKRAKEFFYK